MESKLWTVTQVAIHLDDMAAACNELEQAGHEIKFIIPLGTPECSSDSRHVSYIGIFSTKSISVIDNQVSHS